MIAEWLVRFYDQPRGRIVCFLGAFVISPTLTKLRREIRSDERRIAQKTMLMGRLALTEKLLSRWWKK